MSNETLRVDWPACKAHGLCAEMLPEVVSLDEWGYPIVHGPVAPEDLEMAKATVKSCPTLALRLLKPAMRAVRANPCASPDAEVTRPGLREWS